MRRMIMGADRIAVMVWTGIALVACSDDRPRPHGPPPEQVSVPGGNVKLGFALGATHRDTQVAGFSITKMPITVGDYRRCVRAGACSVPEMQAGPCAQSLGADGWTYTDEADHDDLPITCVVPQQAKDYCDFVSGRLPTLAEWELAARGSDVRRFAWGDIAPTCDRAARTSFFAGVRDACCGVSCNSSDAARVNRHPAGASPYGVLDVMLTRGELVGPDPSDAQGSGCPPNADGCVVRGIEAGALDGLVPPPAPSETQSGVLRFAAYGFRCAWDGGRQ